MKQIILKIKWRDGFLNNLEIAEMNCGDKMENFIQRICKTWPKVLTDQKPSAILSFTKPWILLERERL